MMRRLFGFIRDREGSAAAEMALVMPMMLALLFGSVELGNLFLDEHALSKQVRDGARFASRLELSETYDCDTPATVFADADATTKIINVTKEGVVTGSGKPRWSSYWTRTCTGEAQTLTVSIRCVPKADIDKDDSGNTGIYTSLDGTEIPVVMVEGAVRYRSVLASLGFNATNLCLRAESEVPVQGL